MDENDTKNGAEYFNSSQQNGGVVFVDGRFQCVKDLKQKLALSIFMVYLVHLALIYTHLYGISLKWCLSRKVSNKESTVEEN